MKCFRLYMNGINFKPADMYTPEPLPVSRGTQNIASLVKWDHSQSWSVATAENFLNRGGSSGKVQLLMEVDISSPESKDYYLTGHTIDGRILFPATGYLVSH